MPANEVVSGKLNISKIARSPLTELRLRSIFCLYTNFPNPSTDKDSVQPEIFLIVLAVNGKCGKILDLSVLLLLLRPAHTYLWDSKLVTLVHNYQDRSNPDKALVSPRIRSMLDTVYGWSLGVNKSFK